MCERYVRKGTKLYIEGKLTTRSWEGRDGVKHYQTEVVVENMELCDKPQQSQQPQQYQQPQAQPAPMPGSPAPMQQQYQQPAQPPYQGPGVDDLPY